MIINVNNVNIYYEMCGKGAPIILLHGNSENIDIFDKLVEKLKLTNTVYLIDSRCHGQSENTKKISYELMAQDVIEFIQKLNISKPILYGFSDGGIICLLIAIKEPHLLSKIISLESLHTISIPTYILAGENDVIKYEHTKLIADNIENSTLEILPGENHSSYVVHSEKLYNIIKKYI